MNFGSGPAVGGGAGGGNFNAGPDIESIETEQLAFHAVAGEDKLKLLPTPWPTDQLPLTTSSLLSVASSKGLVAAAGPETLVVTSTDSIRNSFIHDAADGETKVKNYTPQATLRIPRVSQVAFASDESCLVIAAEQGGGLAVYDTNTLSNAAQQPAFQLATENQSVRQLIPNPNPSQDSSRYFGIVTANGQLLLADLKEQKLVQGANGSVVFHENVSCACWSRLGKQIVAGLADGTAVQIDQQGVVKAEIPAPPQPSAQGNPVTAIFWLETYDFLIIHTPLNGADSDDSIYHLAHKDKATNAWTFRKFDDPCPPFGLERKPAHHYVQRLREWGSLSDLLLLASTASTDIGIFTRSKAALDSRTPIVDSFTYTQPPDQSRAAMPMPVGDGTETSPIGVAWDMSVKEKVEKPIPNDEELEESPVPLPALYVLNNEGMLSMWWIVYNESVRQSQMYPDLIAAGGPRALGDQKPQPAQPTPSAQPAQTSTFGQSSQPSAFGGFAKPANPPSAFGASRPESSGAPSTTSFGGASMLGNKSSPWGASTPTSSAPAFGAPAFGKPSFGTPSAPSATPSGAEFGKSSFGTPSAPGATTGTSQFGKPSFGTPSAPAGGSGFGQVGGMGANKGSIWGAPPQQQPSTQSPAASSGKVFGSSTPQQSSFMNVGGAANGAAPAASPFAAFGGGSKENQKPSIFGGNKPSLSAEPSGSTISFGTGSSFNSGSTNFGIKSISSPDPASQNGGSSSIFNQPSPSREESMEDDDTGSSQPSTIKPAEETKTPFAGFKLGSTFKGDGSAKDDLPKPKDAGMGLFGKGFGDALDVKSPTKGPEQAAWMSSGTSTPPIKEEPKEGGERKLNDIPAATIPAPKKEEAPAPPVDDAPLPPDPTTWKPKPGALPPPTPPGFDFSKKDGGEVKKAAPDFTSVNKVPSAEKPLAGSPPVDLGSDKFSEGEPSEAGPPDEDDDSADWNSEDDDEEGEQQSTPEVTDQKGLSAFESRLTPASPKRASKREDVHVPSTTPATDQKSSYTPAGMPKAPVMFAPPTRKGNESPRSPSPIRSATSPQRQMPSFNFQQPSKPLPQQSTAGSRTPSIQQQAQPTPKLPPSRPEPQTQPQRIAVPPGELVGKPKPIPSFKPTEPDAGDLEDDEDARIQAILASPPEPTTGVPAFLAHQDYVATSSSSDKTGIGGQIERVYRDINSMIDTLALNARNLQGFVDGHSQTQAQKERFDLEEEDGWLFGEAEDLQAIMEGIDRELADGQLEDVHGLLGSLRDEDKQIGSLRSKSVELRKQVQARRDTDQQRDAALPWESQTQQSELRQGVLNVQKLLVKAEEQVSLLRAELASLPSQNQDGKAQQVPTVEAVTNTILRMTAMIERKSGDIDVLESQIRRLGGPSALRAGTPDVDDLAVSLKASRISNSSPAGRRSIMRNSIVSPSSGLRASRIGAQGTPGRSPFSPRKSLFDVSEEEADAYRAKKEARRRAMGRLRDVVAERGVRVVRVGGDA